MIDLIQKLKDEGRSLHTFNDHDYVMLVDMMPRIVEDDETADYAAVDAARTSYQTGTRRTRTEEGLCRYLVRHAHTSPIEQIVFKFELRMPIFVAAQHNRHRMASLNQESARYSVIDECFYLPLPSDIRVNDQRNRQATDVVLEGPQAQTASELIAAHSEASYELYRSLLDMGVAREQARIILPQNIYTRMVWTMDLHNLFHYIRLRTDVHAQKEIRDHANAMFEIVKDVCPLLAKAYLDYHINAYRLTVDEIKLLCSPSELQELISRQEYPGLSKGEASEFEQKLNSMLRTFN